MKYTLATSLTAISLAVSSYVYADNSQADKQQQEIEFLKSQLKQTQQNLEALANQVESKSASSALNGIHIGGYGEHHFNRYFSGAKNDQVDAHRYVIYLGKEFSDTVRFVSEFELEHSIAGEGKKGEVELEQAYIEWDFAQDKKAQIGLFLVPIGIINETHEPDTFYGVERNNVEKNIIPATWWETGAQVIGQFGEGFSYNLAVHSGLHLSEPKSVRNGRQKSAEALANDWAVTGRVKYTGIPGLELATSLQYQNDIKQNKNEGDEAAATLIEAHAVYQLDALTLKALYASWNIDNTAFKQTGYDKQTGYYLEAGYKVLPDVGVFARHSNWDNLAGGAAKSDITLNEIGVNYWLHPRVVLKADIGNETKSGSDASVVNLGVGWSF